MVRELDGWYRKLSQCKNATTSEVKNQPIVDIALTSIKQLYSSSVTASSADRIFFRCATTSASNSWSFTQSINNFNQLKLSPCICLFAYSIYFSAVGVLQTAVAWPGSIIYRVVHKNVPNSNNHGSRTKTCHSMPFCNSSLTCKRSPNASTEPDTITVKVILSQRSLNHKFILQFAW